MTFAERLRSLRQEKSLSQRALAEKVGVDFTYLSKIENQKLNFGDYPSEELIQKLANALQADSNELLVLAQKIPPLIRQRVFERPEAFLKLAQLDDSRLNTLMTVIDEQLAEMPTGGGSLIEQMPELPENTAPSRWQQFE